MGNAPSGVPTPTVNKNRLEAFAKAFKNYMGVMPLVTAALAPLLTFLRALPTYESQRTTLATLSGILGFLLLGWIFYVRRTIALGSLTRGFRFMINLLPFFLIIGTLASFLYYFQYLGKSADQALREAKAGQYKYMSNDGPTNFATKSDVFKHWDDRSIPDNPRLELLYLGIFLLPECAFVLMALREYINDTLQISEIEWMFADQNADWLKGVRARVLPRTSP